MECTTLQKMNIFTKMGADITYDFIKKDPEYIRKGYERILENTEFVDSLIQQNNLQQEDLYNLAIDIKDGVHNNLKTIEEALENPKEYNLLEVAWALSESCNMLNYVRHKYSLNL